jgi:uncharacterized protein (AIM24 family)
LAPARIGAGFFGGGFILQKVTGPGVVRARRLRRARSNATSTRESGSWRTRVLSACSRSVGFDIQMVSGFRNILFGGESLFLATLTGPGRIWPRIQSMPILNLAEEIGRYLPICDDPGAISAAGTLGTAATLGAAGSILVRRLGQVRSGQIAALRR